MKILLIWLLIKTTKEAILKSEPTNGSEIATDSSNKIKEYKQTYPLETAKDFTMPATSTDKLSLPSFDVKDNKIPNEINRKLMIPGLGGGGITAPAPVITPVQFPGILNPTIYLQNTQAAPIFPQLNAPPVNLNVHVNGLEDYYKPNPVVVHQTTNVITHDNTAKLKYLVHRFFN